MSIKEPLQAVRIMFSTKYDRFKRIEHNRPIRPKHVLTIIDSMKVKVLLIPIIVTLLKANKVLGFENGDYGIIDGQHRALAYQELNLPIPFIVTDGLTIEDVQTINTKTVTWTLEETIVSHASRGNVNYQKLIGFKNTYHHGFYLCGSVLSGRVTYGTAKHGTISSDLRSGAFKVSNYPYATNRMDYVEAVISRLPEYRFTAFKDNFVKAVLQSATIPGFDEDRFLKRLEGYSEKNRLLNQSRMDNFVMEIEEAYNHRLKDKLSIFFPWKAKFKTTSR